MADLETIRARFSQFINHHDLGGAAIFLAASFSEAKESGDLEAAAYIGDLYASSLMAIGRDLEALEIFRELLRDFSRDVYLRLRIATFLTTLLKRPSEALETLEPALTDLLEDKGARHATLGVLGANHAALGNLTEAKKCFTLMLEHDLSTMDPSTFDFLLVEALTTRQEMKEQCREYLLIVLRQAQKTSDEGVASRAGSLLRALGV